MSSRDFGLKRPRDVFYREAYPPPMFQTFLQIALWVSTMALGIGIFLKEHPLFTYLFIDQDWDEDSSLLALRVCASLLIATATLGAWKGFRVAWLLTGCGILALSLAESTQAARMPWLVPFAKAALWLPPILLAAFPASQRTQALFVYGLRIAVASTFAAHGLQAFTLDPTFLDLMFMADERLGLNLSPSQWAVERALMGIGVLDLAIALLLLFRRSLKTVYWMAFWGFLAAASRPLHFGTEHLDYGLTEALQRFANGGVPLALALHFRSLRKTR